MEVRGGSPWPGHIGVTPTVPEPCSSRQLRNTISMIIKSGTCGRMLYHYLPFADEQIEAQRAGCLV